MSPDTTLTFISSIDPLVGFAYLDLAANNETAELVSLNPLYPPILGGFLKLEDTPRPPAGSILHLFFSGLIIYHPNLTVAASF
jgi:hypothetical protein